MSSTLRLEEVYLKTVKRIRIESSNGNEFALNLETLFGRNSPQILPNCRLVELNTTNTTGVPKRIKIELLKTENVSFHMKIVEKNTALAKRLEMSYAYNGPFLGIDNLKEAKSLFFGLRLKQSHYSEQDVEANCVDYPTKRFKSYRECDEDFIIKEMQKIGVMPFWAAKDKLNVTASK